MRLAIATLNAFFVLFVAARGVVVLPVSCGLTLLVCVPLLCFQLVMIFGVFVGAAMLAVMLAATLAVLGAQNLLDSCQGSRNEE